MDLSLRRVEPADRGFLLQVYAGTRADELALTGWDTDSCERFLRMQFDAQCAHYERHWPKSDHSVIQVGTAEHLVPVGRLWVDHRTDALHVLDIALLPDWRGRGLGSTCLRRLMDEAAASGLPLTIFVEHDNPARRLYERLGFNAVGEPQGMHQRMAWPAQLAVMRQTEETCSEQA